MTSPAAQDPESRPLSHGPSRITPDGPWQRYVAVGDSFTEGLEDPAPGRAEVFAGWADRLALALDSAFPGIEYANLAIRGKVLAQVVNEQLPAAMDMRPDLVSFMAGANDLLRPRADVDALAEQLEAAVALFRAEGIDVLLVTHTDPGSAAFFRRLRGRYAVFTGHVRAIAARQGCPIVDLWGMRDFRDARMWAPDRLHMSTPGHRLLAHTAAAALGLPVPAAPSLEPRPSHEQLSRLGRRRHNAAWVTRHLAPWVLRRVTGKSSGDLLTAKRPRPVSLADVPLPPLD